MMVRPVHLGLGLLVGAAACSQQRADPPAQTPMPELTLSGVRAHVIEGMRCALLGTMTNTGPIAVSNAELRLAHDQNARLEILATLRLDDVAVQESRPFRMTYACDSLVGSRLLRVYRGRHAVRLIEEEQAAEES